MVKGERSINGAGFYDENPKNLRLKVKFIKNSIEFTQKKNKKLKESYFKEIYGKEKR